MSYGIYTEHTTTIWDTFYVYYIFLSDLNTTHVIYTFHIYLLHIYRIRKRSKFMSYVGTPVRPRAKDTPSLSSFYYIHIEISPFSFLSGLLKSHITVYPKSCIQYIIIYYMEFITLGRDKTNIIILYIIMYVIVTRQKENKTQTVSECCTCTL